MSPKSRTTSESRPVRTSYQKGNHAPGEVHQCINLNDIESIKTGPLKKRQESLIIRDANGKSALCRRLVNENEQLTLQPQLRLLSEKLCQSQAMLCYSCQPRPRWQLLPSLLSLSDDCWQDCWTIAGVSRNLRVGGAIAEVKRPERDR